uniref:SHC-transforming protein 1 n=1 Tax=Phallusia mammillata TaxID=59560 RepID=A0A6F9DRI1_9ASCI|nr:SHC-transforming protein 1 [Phallusia mammillata]
MMRKAKKTVEGDQTNEWRKSGSFVNKPQRGWLHPDNAVMGPGVVYSVQYLGCIEVRQSMRTLDFDMRTLATKEAIWRVLAASGISPLPPAASRRKKPPKDVTRILGDRPNLQFSQAFINLTISTASLTLVVTNTGQFIANHQMQSISFASGGDPDTIDYVAYVAKDPINNRACHVLKCADGLAQDVINTVGQAFELRFKEYLKNPPKAVTPPDRTEPLFHDGKSRWGDDEPEYYNEIPGKMAPESGLKRMDDDGNVGHVTTSAKSQEYINNGVMANDGASSATPTPTPRRAPARSFEDHNYVNTSVMPHEVAPTSRPVASGPTSKSDRNLIDLATPPTSPNKQVSAGMGGALQLAAAIGVSRDEHPTNHQQQKRPSVDTFDMRPFATSIQQQQQQPPSTPNTLATNALQGEPWFHGNVTRKEAEDLLTVDGDFLVRESSSTRGQFVLSGVQEGQFKHLLLVDPNGVVRTKDRQFDSVGHLISFHRDNNLPIVSSGSVLLLRQPVTRQIER